MDKEKVIKGLEHCIAEGKDCRGCIYYEQMINEKESCACRSDALDVIRDLQSQIAMLVVAQHELCEMMKEQGCAKIKEPDCRICGQSHCKYYHESRKPTECRSYIRNEWSVK